MAVCPGDTRQIIVRLENGHFQKLPVSLYSKLNQLQQIDPNPKEKYCFILIWSHLCVRNNNECMLL